MDSEIRQKLEELGWLFSNKVLLGSLTYPPTREGVRLVGEAAEVRDLIVQDLLSGKTVPTSSPDPLGGGRDVVVAEVERYGLPLRTVLSLDSGLMRSDPYYNKSYLKLFYQRYYRKLYMPEAMNFSKFLADQIARGNEIRKFIGAELPAKGNVLELGCGAGGALVPFLLAGHGVCGYDYDQSYLNVGETLGLNLQEGGVESLSPDSRYQLIILSHVLEHVVEPIEFLRSIAKHLADDGLLYIEVPGIFNLRYVYGSDVLQYLQNAHVWHFTARTLEALLGRAGYSVKKSNEHVRCLTAVLDVKNVDSGSESARIMSELVCLERKRPFAGLKVYMRKVLGL